MERIKTHIKYFIPFYIAIAFLLIMFNSCITEKKRAEICKTCAVKTVIKDSIRIEIKEKQIPVFITDTFTYFLPNPCAKLCDSIGNLKPTFKDEIKSNKGTTISLFVKDNKLHFVDVLDSLKRLIWVKDSTIKTYQFKNIEVESKCKKDHINWLKQTLIYLGIFFLIIVFVFVGYKALKYYKKFYLP